ncbi:hypothetical protein HanIR_Chr05g0220701 [Helianthus annuus]|nr:hypothetical protein HanIR_Chr05g0220701 [Helianthus annuus]
MLTPSAAHDLQFPPNIQHPFFQITSGIELGSSDIHIGCDLDLGLCLLTVLPYFNIHCEEKRHFLEAMMMNSGCCLSESNEA